MRKAILGLFAASAMGCAAVNDGRLETAVNAAVPIPMVDGEVGLRGTIETPPGICNGQAEVLLRENQVRVECNGSTFYHTIRKPIVGNQYHVCELNYVMPEGPSIPWADYDCDGIDEGEYSFMVEHLLDPNYTYPIDLHDEGYQSVKQQMNVQEAERLWREWRHRAFGGE